MAADKPPRPPAKKAAAKKPPAKKRAAEKGTPAGPPAAPAAPSAPSAPARRSRPTEPATEPERGRTEPSQPPGATRRKITDAAKRVATPKPGKTYHRMVLAEFIICIVLVLIGAILTPRIKNGVLEFVHVLVQSSAVCFVFFVLALLGAGKSTGKVAAAFGLLITLGVLLNNTGAILEIGKIFAGPKPQLAKSDTGV